MSERISPKVVIGLTGGIGAGKSAVAGLLGEAGCCVISSDRLSHEVLENPAVLSEIADWWGPDVRLPDGSPNRSRIGELVFTDGERKRRLESLLYPLIAERRRSIISEVNSQPAIKAIVLDSPLLFESALDRLCDFIIFVDASRPQRLARVQSSRGWDDAELSRREAWQKTLEFKRSQSHFVIENNGTLDDLRMRVDALLARVLREWREGNQAQERG